MRQCRTISASMERPHSPKITSSPAACDTLSCLLRELDAQPTDFDCIVTGDLGRVGADLLLTLLREDGIDLSRSIQTAASCCSVIHRTLMQAGQAAAARRLYCADRFCAICTRGRYAA